MNKVIKRWEWSHNIQSINLCQHRELLRIGSVYTWVWFSVFNFLKKKKKRNFSTIFVFFPPRKKIHVWFLDIHTSILIIFRVFCSVTTLPLDNSSQFFLTAQQILILQNSDPYDHNVILAKLKHFIQDTTTCLRLTCTLLPDNIISCPL